MPEIEFTKGHGTGNDFVLIPDPDGELELTPDIIAAICDRHFGIGADGILRVVRSAAIAEGAEGVAGGAEWFMDYRNADGSVAEMCGNGIRVFAHYLTSRGFAEFPPDRPLPIATRAGIKDLVESEDGFAVDIGTWRRSSMEPTVRAHRLPVARPGLGIDVGNPHVVVALATLDELEAIDLSIAPDLEPAPAEGANVEFVVPEEPLVADGVGRIRMRVHERGSGETLSCGTGVVASALAIRYYAGDAAPDEWQVDVPGGRLGVHVEPREDGEHAWLSGPAVLVFDGTFTF